eukprot:s722_g21.t1
MDHIFGPGCDVWGCTSQILSAHFARMVPLSSKRIIELLKEALANEAALKEFAQGIGTKQSRQKNDSAFALIQQLLPLARSIWGPLVQLTLHGSRAKNTFIDDSDFDYHIENTPRPITLDEMYDFLERCRQIPGVSPIPKIKMALSLVYHVEGLEDNSIQVELAPEKADYIDDETTIEPLIEKANTYFFENPTACLATRLLKFLFQRTQPRLKACALEQLVQIMHTRLQQADLAGRDCGVRNLFLLCLKQIEEQPECRAMKVTIRKVYPDGLPRLAPSPTVSLSPTRGNPERTLREISPLRCSPERAWRQMSPQGRESYDREISLWPISAVSALQGVLAPSRSPLRGREETRSLRDMESVLDFSAPKFWTSTEGRSSFD